MLEDTSLATKPIFEQLQDRVIPASLDETRNLITTRWEIAIVYEPQSTRWVAPESPRPSLFRMMDVGRYIARHKTDI